jgi:hypothetical protein
MPNLVNIRDALSALHFIYILLLILPLFLQGPLPPNGRDAWQMKFPPMRAPGAYVLAFYGGTNPFHAKVHVRLRLIGGSCSNSDSSCTGDDIIFADSGSRTADACDTTHTSDSFEALDIIVDVGEVKLVYRDVSKRPFLLSFSYYYTLKRSDYPHLSRHICFLGDQMDWFSDTNSYPASRIFHVNLPVCRPIIVEGVTCGRNPAGFGV